MGTSTSNRGALSRLNTILASQRLWAVQQIQNPEKAGPLYHVCKPDTWPLLPTTAALIAFTTTENDAVAVANALHTIAVWAGTKGQTAATDTVNRADAADPCDRQPWKEEGGAKLPYNHIQYEIKKLAGRILTVLDAAFVNEQQNKAVKRLVKDEIRTKISKFWEQCFTSTYNSGEEGGENVEKVLD